VKPFRHPSIRQPICSIIYYSGFLYLWRQFANKGRPLIVYYHEVFDETDNVEWCHEKSLLLPLTLFREQLSYLSQHYKIVSLDEAVLSKSSNVAAITFDDGYLGVYRNAFPILKSMGITATVFLITNYLGSAEIPWWNNLIFQLNKFLSKNEEERRDVAHVLSGKWRFLVRRNVSIEAIFNTYLQASLDERKELGEFLTKSVGNYNSQGE
jgi:hypothetical protein